ncbi:hypothetical protein ACFFX0_11740 [Citricoccus parietis]|uniref:Uncharacterized protein n=1 Tax=Citricoccus parietis TaxID=592307 RepID=A0ABV5FYS3_9MICC
MSAAWRPWAPPAWNVRPVTYVVPTDVSSTVSEFPAPPGRTAPGCTGITTD